MAPTNRPLSDEWPRPTARSVIAADLLALLVDPDDKSALIYFSDEASLYNPTSKRRYPVRDNHIPILLVDEAETVGDDEHARLLAKASREDLKTTGTEGHS